MFVVPQMKNPNKYFLYKFWIISKNSKNLIWLLLMKELIFYFVRLVIWKINGWP